jgi:hypothetical protein
MARPIDPDQEIARKREDKIYVSKRPCPRGHFLRWVSSSGCHICQLARQNAKYAAKIKYVAKVKTPKEKPFRKSGKLRAARIKAAPSFNAKVRFELAEYAHSPGAKRRSAHLNQLINGIVEHAARDDFPRAIRPRGGAFHQFKRVPV